MVLETSGCWQERPTRPLHLAALDLRVEAKDGCLEISNAQPSPSHASTLASYLKQAVARYPTRTALAEKIGGTWHHVSYAQFAARVDEIARILLARGVGRGARIASISPNSIAVAELQMAAVSVGAIFVPVSVNYAQGRTSYETLSSILELVAPDLLITPDKERLLPILEQAKFDCSRVFAGERALRESITDLPSVEQLRTMQGAVQPADPAKLMLTSGSTGRPKAVVNTHGMILSNQAGISAMWPFLLERPPVVVSWLPWNHVMGGNFVFFMMLSNGGTYFIDSGRPTASGVAETFANLCALRPTLHFDVPRGLDALLPLLETDLDGAGAIFGNLDAICYSGAALSDASWSRLNKVAVRSTGYRVPILTSWGATETGPAVTLSAQSQLGASYVGGPLPGVSVKLVPVNHVREAYVRGPSVFPEYWRALDASIKAFDAHRYYRTGDAMEAVMHDGAEVGLRFEGRVLENFKLSNGNWVEVGSLRIRVLSATAPILQDCVVVGEGRDELGILGFVDLAGLNGVISDLSTDLGEVVSDPRVRNLLYRRLQAFNSLNPTPTTAIRRFAIEARPLSIEDGEIADKGYVNQRAVIANRRDAIERLFTRPTDEMLCAGVTG